MTLKIGVLVGRENTWPPAFIEEVNRRNAGVTAEFVKLSGTCMAEEARYAVIVDRISHEVPYYRTFLKTAAIGGTHVVNNPFWWSADEKFTGATIATRLGIAHPRTVALPSHSYIPAIHPVESLRNLEPRIPWEQHVEYVGGFPLILKPHAGGGFKQVYKVYDMQGLWSAYNESGTECMMMQEFIHWDKYVRCLVIGREHVLVMKFDVSAPYPHRYFDEPDYLTPEEHERVVRDALTLCRALGYDMNTVEFAIKDGVPYAIDFTNPAPDMDYWSLKEKFFRWAVTKMADMCIAKAHSGLATLDEIHWSRLLNPPNAVAEPKKRAARKKKNDI